VADYLTRLAERTLGLSPTVRPGSSPTLAPEPAPSPSFLPEPEMPQDARNTGPPAPLTRGSAGEAPRPGDPLSARPNDPYTSRLEPAVRSESPGSESPPHATGEPVRRAAYPHQAATERHTARRERREGASEDPAATTPGPSSAPAERPRRELEREGNEATHRAARAATPPVPPDEPPGTTREHDEGYVGTTDPAPGERSDEPIGASKGSVERRDGSTRETLGRALAGEPEPPVSPGSKPVSPTERATSTPQRPASPATDTRNTGRLDAPTKPGQANDPDGESGGVPRARYEEASPRASGARAAATPDATGPNQQTERARKREGPAAQTGPRSTEREPSPEPFALEETRSRPSPEPATSNRGEPERSSSRRPLPEAPLVPVGEGPRPVRGQATREFSVEAPSPTIRVTIGRVEVRAAPQAPARRPERKPVPALSLEDYLRQRNGGRR
jgi:hypothetical protein